VYKWYKARSSPSVTDVTPETLTSLSNSDDYCELGASLSSIAIARSCQKEHATKVTPSKDREHDADLENRLEQEPIGTKRFESASPTFGWCYLRASRRDCTSSFHKLENHFKFYSTHIESNTTLFQRDLGSDIAFAARCSLPALALLLLSTTNAYTFHDFMREKGLKAAVAILFAAAMGSPVAAEIHYGVVEDAAPSEQVALAESLPLLELGNYHFRGSGIVPCVVLHPGGRHLGVHPHR
jgi:hypothetical protein